MPVVIYASLRPFFSQGHARFLETYQSLPTVSVLPSPDGQWDDLSLYLLYMEENISELKSYKYIKVCLLHLFPSVQFDLILGSEHFIMKLITVCSRIWTVLEMLKKRGECSGENFDTVGLLQTLCLVKMDTVDGKRSTAKLDQVKMNAAGGAANDGAALNNLSRPNSTSGNDIKMETEMQELSPLLPGTDETGCKAEESGTLRQRVM
ncbi:hypothetical protein XENOCAPTIV_011314 [Xenoophorus captivus]|uniref:Uncharacterized protein n=1 Tax=Xenoophorus captivus TaxID=1517983 RepID=A0ABV0QZT5_9TELE